MSATRTNALRSLRLWLPILLVLSAAVAGLGLYVVEARINRERFEAGFKADQILRTSKLQSDVERWVQRGDLDMVQSVMTEMSMTPELTGAFFLDGSNFVRAATRRDALGRPFDERNLASDAGESRKLSTLLEATRRIRQEHSLFTADGNGLVICSPTSVPLTPGELEVKRDGLILAGYDLRLDRAANLRELRNRFALEFAAILLIAILLGASVHFLITRRLEKLEAIINEFAAGKSKARPPAMLGDEISYLYNCFNEMAAAVGKEMSERKQAEDALRKSAAEIQDLYDLAPCGYHSLDSDGVFVRINNTECSWLGYRREELLGKRRFADLLTPKSAESFALHFPGFKESGSVQDLTFDIVRKDGSILPVLVSATAVKDSEGNFVMTRSVVHDVTERRRAEELQGRLNRELRAISNCNLVLMRAVNEDDLLKEVCRIICQEAGYRMAWVGYVQNGATRSVRPMAWTDSEKGAPDQAAVSHADGGPGDDLLTLAMGNGESVCIQDFASDPRAAAWRGSALRRGYRSGIALPLKNETAALFGVLNIYSEEPHAFTPAEVRLLEELAGDLAFGITVLRARNERKRMDAVNAARLHLIQFAETHSLGELLEETINQAEAITGSQIGFLHFIEENLPSSVQLQSWSTRTKREFCTAEGQGLHYPISQAGVWAECVQARRPVVHNDYAALPNRKGLPPGHAPVVRELVVPVFRADRIKAMLGVGNKADDYGEKDVETVAVLADLAWEITERKRVNDALRASEQKFRTLIGKLQVAVVVHAADTRIVTCNRLAQTLLGLNEDQLLGRASIDPAWHFFREDGTRMPAEEYPVNHVLASRQPLRNLIVGIHRPDDRQDVWALVNANPVFENGKISEVIVTFVDVTDRKETQEKLAHLAAIVECSDDAIIGKNMDERIVSWNRGAERIYGYSAEEIVGQSVSVLIPPGQELELAAIMEGVKRGQGLEHLETVRRRKDGGLIHVALTISPIRSARGQIVGASTIARDITERKWAEEEVRKLNAELEQRVAERTAEIEAKNRALQRMNKLFVGRELQMIRLKKLLLHDLGARTSADEAVKRIDEDPTARAQEREVVSLPDTQAALLNLVEDLNEKSLALEAANKELEAFSYSVSHDLRAPLRSIDGFSRALLDDYGDKLDVEGRENLHTVRSASQRMGQLIDDMLRLAQINRSEMRWTAVNLSEMAEQVAAELQKSDPDRNVEFVIARGCVVNGDAPLLRIALENVLGNAWKYTNKRSCAKIEFGAGEFNGCAAYFVRDNGCGFDMKYANKLFGPFQRLHGGTDFPGTGIGLASVQRILKRHGGRAWIEGRVDEGATLYFTLPKHRSL